MIKAQATAYTADFDNTGKRPGEKGFGKTATGTTARRNSNGYSSVAVDPRVIPLGTKLYIEGYGYGIAEDTGGAIKGNIIDVYFDSNSECINWGRRSVNVYILK
jgi:3D (Asp-Asp-Asp) domain-containing protein